MLLLSAPFDAAAGPPVRPSSRPYLHVILATAMVAAGGVVLDRTGFAPAALGHAIASGAVHGGLIALGWVMVIGPAPGWVAPAVRVGVTVVLASVAARLGPWGPLGLLLVPLVLALEAWRHPETRAIGVGGARAWHAVVGLGAGTFLGLHLLISASLTFGYRVHATSVAAYAAAVGYDLGANVLSAEWLFRGALFSIWWRRWAFWPAALLSTLLGVARYLLDPALPHAPEARAGAIFYLGLVGLAAFLALYVLSLRAACRAWRRGGGALAGGTRLRVTVDPNAGKKAIMDARGVRKYRRGPDPLHRD